MGTSWTAYASGMKKHADEFSERSPLMASHLYQMADGMVKYGCLIVRAYPLCHTLEYPQGIPFSAVRGLRFWCPVSCGCSTTVGAMDCPSSCNGTVKQAG